MDKSININFIHPFQKWSAMFSYQIWVSQVIQSHQQPLKGSQITIPKSHKELPGIFFSKILPTVLFDFLGLPKWNMSFGSMFLFHSVFIHFLTPRDESLGQAHHGNSLNFREMNDWNLQPSPMKRKANDLNQTDRIMFPPLTFRGVTIKDRHPDLCLKKTIKWKHKHI